MAHHDVVGAVGVLLIVSAYLLLQLERIGSRDLRYSLANATGAALVLYSLAFDFNVSAALVEGFWLLISLYGVWASLRSRRSDRMRGA